MGGRDKYKQMGETTTRRSEVSTKLENQTENFISLKKKETVRFSMIAIIVREYK